MIRVLVLTDTNVLAGGGAEQHLKTMLEHLDYSLFRVHVIQLQVTPAVPSREGSLAGATYSHLPTGRLWSLKGLSHLRAIRRHIVTTGYDCVLSFFETSDLISVIAAGPSSGVRARVSSRRDTGFRYSGKLRWVYGRINNRFQRIIAASSAVSDSLAETGVDRQRIRIIYNGVDISRFGNSAEPSLREELSIPSDALTLGMVANLNPVKDHQTVLRALSLLRDPGRVIHLMLAGEGVLEEELKALTRELGLDSVVHFLGRRRDIPRVLNAMDIFVLASRTEGLSNALLEAMAAARPAIATRVGGNPEVVVDGETGVLVPPGDVEQLAAAVERLYNDRALRRQMGLAARKRVTEAFSIEKMVSDYADTLQQALNADDGGH